jgi:hypothetical protein
MARKKRGEQRPFRPEVLERFTTERLRPNLGRRGLIWRFSVSVPLAQISPTRKPKATLRDVNKIRRMCVRHFGGVTLPPASTGYGLRDPDDPERKPELNYNRYFVVLASPIQEADKYFRALREELQEALDEGVILVERQDVWIP